MTLRKVLPWCFTILLTGFPIAAQELPLPGTEAAPTLFSTQLGSPDANLLLSGSWDAQLSGSLGWGLDLGPGALQPGLYPASFPGLQPGIVFQQVPNLTASVVLFDRYFLRASFISPQLQQTNLQSTLPLDLNTFLLGYNGKPGEFLQKVRIGNTDVNISPYSFVSFPAAPRNSIGASVLFKTDRARYEAMVRYEPSNFQSKTFIGSSQLLQQRLNPGAYVNGRFFYLPDANVANLQVYLEDGTGTIPGVDANGQTHYFRLATASDAIISASGGYVFFVKPVVGQVVVTYTVNGASVGQSTANGIGFLPPVSGGALSSSGSAVNFNFGVTGYEMPGYPSGFSLANLKVTINGQTGLLISQPGVFSPFEADNTYTVGQTIPAVAPQVRASLVAKGADSGSSLYVSVSPGGQTATVLGIVPSGGGQTAPDPRSVQARYPFAGVDPTIYSAGPGRATQDSTNEVLVQILSPAAGYQLDPNVLPGSVTVLRNGVSEMRFTVNYDTGLLTFNTPIAANDLIVVTYQTANPQGSGGNILFGMGADFALSPNLDLDLGTGLRWSLLSQRYTTEQGTNTGALLSGVGLTYHTKELTARLRAGVSLSSPDTTGIFRLFGMEESGQTLTLSESNLFPSSLPGSSETISSGLNAGLSPFSSLTLANRGELLYKDLNSYSLGGATLEGATFNPPSSQIYPYVNGSRIGPYPAWDNTYGVVMVMDYVIDPSASSNPSTWVGAQVPLPNAPQDLTGITDLTFAIQSLAGASGTVTAYVQLGSVSEDLDGSGVIQRASSIANNLFPFHQNGMTLYAGATGTGGSSLGSTSTSGTANPSSTNGLALASDDLNGNGLLDAENAGLVLTYQIAASYLTAGAGWQSVDIPIPPADRAKLTAARSVRVILVDTVGPASGRILVSSPTFAGSPFHVVTASTTPTDITTATETSDPLPLGQQLTDRYPEVNTIYHPAGQLNKVLRVEWGPWSTATGFTLTGYPPPVAPGLYRTLAFYMYVPTLSQTPSPATLSMSLVDSAGHGIHLSFQPGQTSGWHKYSVDLIAKTISVDGGTPVGAPSVTVDGAAGQLTTFTLSQTGSNAGTFYIDEVHLENAIISASLGTDLNVRYAKQGTLLSLFGHPIVSNLTVHEAASATGSNFGAGFAENPGVAAASTLTEVGGDLPFANLQASFGYLWSPVYTTVSASHAIRMPIGPLTLADSYNQSVSTSGASSGALVTAPSASSGTAVSATSTLAGSSIGTGAQSMSFARSDTATLSIPAVGTASISSGSVTLGGGIDQSWNASLASLFQPPFSISLAGQLGDNLPSFTPYSDQYFTNWAQGFRLLAPLSDPLAERNGSFTSDFAFARNPVGVDLKSQINYDSTVTNIRSQANSTSVTLSFPISLGKQTLLAWQVVPAYTRTLTTSAPATANAGFGDDFRTYGASLAASPILYEGVPVAELFSPSALAQFTSESTGFVSAIYIPTVSLQLSRGSTSSLSDLIVPTYLLLSYGRTMDREADGVTDTATWQITARTDVLNLFGRQGLYPIFPFYNTDEFATTVNIQESTPAGTSVATGTALIQHLFSFYGANKSLLSFQNNLTVNWGAIRNVGDDLTTSFTWRRIPHEGFKVPVVPASFQKGMYFEHTESVEIKSLPDVLQNSFGATLSHLTALIFPQQGKIQASAGIGFQENKITDTDTRLLFGVQAAIEGTLSF